MNRMMIACVVAVAAAAVSVPAVAGLTNNPSFSHRLPVHVPSQAKVVQLDDHGKVVDAGRTRHPAATTVTSARHSAEPEPGGGRRSASSVPPNNGGGRSTDAGDERGSGGGGSSNSGGGSDGGRSGGSGSGHGG